MSEADKIPVYILTASDKSPLGKRVKGFFSNPLFDASRVVVDDPNDDLLKDSYNSIEFYRIKHILKDAQKNHGNKDVVIIKDTSITTHSPDEIANYISKFSEMKDWDIFYLSYWQEKCEKRTNLGKIGDKVIGTPYAPHGFQAVMIGPGFRDIIIGDGSFEDGSNFHLDGNFSNTLRSLISSKKIVPRYTNPNIFKFDPELAKDEKDILKLNECMDLQSYQETGNTGNSNTWIWVLVVLALLVIFGGILYKNKRG